MTCKAIMELYGEEFLRKPTYTDMEKLYAYHDEKHGFPGMLGSIDCTGWPSPYSGKKSYVDRRREKTDVAGKIKVAGGHYNDEPKVKVSYLCK
ncbi:putative nuclease HARBI1 [Tanacetum coccineum]